MPNKVLSLSDLQNGLENAGAIKGRHLIVHSSYRAFGKVEGGPLNIVKSLMNLISEEGLLMMPSFNHGAPFAEEAPGYYDPKTTPTTNGIIPELFRQQPGVTRSLNPTHPFASWGKNAIEYTKNHHQTLTMGLESPIGKLYQHDGYILLLGVTCRANTFHHLVETLLEVPCLGKRTEEYPVLHPDGVMRNERTWGWRNAACPLVVTGSYQQELEKKGLIKKTLIGPCEAILIRMQPCKELLMQRYTNGADGHPPCVKCSIRPRRVKQTVESDYCNLRA